ncbi:MAG: BlaI/MecI/CopY family transcriptional regulator [Planctomycetota bacterium]|nr:BlaI/MecI/CopY family transcriptional regulator [Planctomycetota bacterium]
MTPIPPGPPQPTRSELELLRVLWRRGPATVRELHHERGPGRGVGYTTVLKLLQIMAAKGLVERDESRRSHVYAARVSEGDTQRRLLGDLMERAFEGSASKLVMQALSAQRATPEELSAIRRLLDELEGEAS